MIYSEYGKTGAKVSVVGFGGMRFDESKSNEDNAELLLYAQSKGINYFDTAPTYCSDTSEDIFGAALKQMAESRDSYYVSTKGMPVDFDTADKARAAVEKSMKRLNVEKIDFYHVWCIRRVDQYELAMKKGGQYEGLMKCKEEGLIGNIVISTHLSGPEIKKIIKKNEFEGILLGVNILNFPYRWEGIQAAYEANLGVVAMNPLSGGLIPQHEEKFAFLAQGNETPIQAGLRFCIMCPQITVTLVGFTTKEHINIACGIADAAKPFTDEDIDRVRAHVSEHMNALCTGCGYCVKCCPENIPVANYMQIYNEKPLFKRTEKEMIEKIEFNYKWGLLADRLANAGDCVKCEACEEACTQHLNIIERLEEIDAWEKKTQSS
ncbi:MAG: aldo/keto reductase [Sedimentisphaerales bacterium]|nr:aldo/keto reductase [Sedimentisphaerales bacterium]